MRPPRVVALGGGHGLAASLGALRHVTHHLTAVVTVADDGGSSGRLREELGCLPPGDLRMALSALCDDSDWGHVWRDVLQFRFSTEGPLNNHATGNLLIATVWEKLGDPVEGLALVGRLLGARGTVLPMSLKPLVISGTVESAGETSRVVGQHRLAMAEGRVLEVQLEPDEPPACPQAVEAILEADAVVLGPGSWYTSVIPHLLVPDLRAALHSTKARRFLTMNLIAQKGETEGLRSGDHLRVLHAYAPGLTFDTVVSDPAAIDDLDDFTSAAELLGARVMLRQVTNAAIPGTHDPLRLAAAYRDAFEDILGDVS